MVHKECGSPGENLVQALGLSRNPGRGGGNLVQALGLSRNSGSIYTYEAAGTRKYARNWDLLDSGGSGTGQVGGTSTRSEPEFWQAGWPENQMCFSEKLKGIEF